MSLCDEGLELAQVSASDGSADKKLAAAMCVALPSQTTTWLATVLCTADSSRELMW